MSKKQKKPRRTPQQRWDGLTGSIHRQFAALLSNLRFSLTLRIALHYAGRLLSSTLLMLLITAAVFAAAQIPTVNATFDALAAMTPAQGEAYAQSQLVGLPLREAYLTDTLGSKGFQGLLESLAFTAGDFGTRAHPTLRLYRLTDAGGTVAVFSLSYVLYVLTFLAAGLVCCDLTRVWLFLRQRDKLNRRVLRPIAEMAGAAERLSANNLSSRINIEGTKNELKDLAAVINSMLDRIERSYNSQKQFVSDASHELRTPIAVIQGYASMLERWGKTDKAVLDEGIAAISQEAASMKELVERLLFLARHDKKTLMLEMEVFDPTEVMSAVHREAALLSPAHVFAFAPVEHARIKADKSMLKQLMRILVDNAIKYTPPGGKITLSARNDGQSCVLAVADTGPGIPKQELGRIFDRFYRSDSARKTQSSGHGLGLSIARIIVTANGGKLSVRTKEGVGTTFLVRLPLER